RRGGSGRVHPGRPGRDRAPPRDAPAPGRGRRMGGVGVSNHARSLMRTALVLIGCGFAASVVHAQAPAAAAASAKTLAPETDARGIVLPLQPALRAHDCT